MAIDLINDIIEFWEKIKGSKESLIKFVKKDGSVRLMRCTLDFKNIPKQHHPKNINTPGILKLAKNSKILRVYDLDKHGWRSVPFDKTEWIENTVDKKRLFIKK